jgi:hypothetical protein
MIISLVINGTLLLISLFLWRKYHNSNYLGYAVLLGVVVVARVMEYCIDTLLVLSQEQKAIEYYTLTSIRGVVVVFFLVFFVRDVFGKSNRVRTGKRETSQGLVGYPSPKLV